MTIPPVILDCGIEILIKITGPIGRAITIRFFPIPLFHAKLTGMWQGNLRCTDKNAPSDFKLHTIWCDFHLTRPISGCHNSGLIYYKRMDKTDGVEKTLMQGADKLESYKITAHIKRNIKFEMKFDCLLHRKPDGTANEYPSAPDVFGEIPDVFSKDPVLLFTTNLRTKNDRNIYEWSGELEKK